MIIIIDCIDTNDVVAAEAFAVCFDHDFSLIVFGRIHFSICVLLLAVAKNFLLCCMRESDHEEENQQKTKSRTEK